jgi:hypothetical protein
MKYYLGLFSLAFVLQPVAALAHDASPAPAPPALSAPAGPNRGAFFERMRENRARMEQMLVRSRAQILGALTPAHRALLGRLVGELAVAPNPDPRAATRQLDAALSASERQAVISAADNAREQIRSFMQEQRGAWRGWRSPNGPAPGAGATAPAPGAANASPPGGMGYAPPPGGPGGPMREEHRRMTPDAGRILLHVAFMRPHSPHPGPR